jgi:expansin (peptidoglycan-binding protein)
MSRAALAVIVWGALGCSSGGGSAPGGGSGGAVGATGGASGTGGVSGSGGSGGGSGGVGGSSGSGGGSGSVGGSSGSGGSSGIPDARPAPDVAVDAEPPDPGPTSGGGANCTDIDQTHQGTATFFAISASSTGNCSFDLGKQPQPPYWTAMNGARYANASDCGACIEATGARGGPFVYQVVDSCKVENGNPVCASMEHLDLSQQGFSRLGDPATGKINITWHYVPCQATGSVQVFAQKGSMRCNARLNIRNHRYRIAKVELRNADGSYTPLKRGPDNIYVIDSVLSPMCLALGPYRLRITDIYGHWIENRLTLTESAASDMGLQFPRCG